MTPARTHERELPEDEGFRLVSATAGIKGIKRLMPLEAWCCALHAHPLAGSMSEQIGNDDVIMGGRGVVNSTAAGPRVPCAVTFLGKERVDDHRGGSGCGAAAGGSCLRSVFPRIIPKPLSSHGGLSTLGREHSVLRYSVEGNSSRTYEVPDHHTFRACGHRARRRTKDPEHKSHWDTEHSRVRALAGARDLSLLFGHDVKFGCLVQWDDTMCYTVVPNPSGHDVDDPDPQVQVDYMPRLLGAFLLGDVWNLVGHCGSTPDEDERAAADERWGSMGYDSRFSPEHLLPLGFIPDTENDEALATCISTQSSGEATMAHAAACSTTRLFTDGSTAAHAAASSTKELEGTPRGADGFVLVPSCPVRGTPP